MAPNSSDRRIYTAWLSCVKTQVVKCVMIHENCPLTFLRVLKYMCPAIGRNMTNRTAVSQKQPNFASKKFDLPCSKQRRCEAQINWWMAADVPAADGPVQLSRRGRLIKLALRYHNYSNCKQFVFNPIPHPLPPPPLYCFKFSKFFKLSFLSFIVYFLSFRLTPFLPGLLLIIYYVTMTFSYFYVQAKLTIIIV